MRKRDEHNRPSDDEGADDGRMDETMVEDFLDCTGKKRRFRLQSYAAGMFLDAVEMLGGNAGGMRFIMKMNEHGHLPWGEMRQRIRDRLAQRDVVVDPDSGRLRILNRLVRARIDHVPTPDERDDDGPIVIVDDHRVTWRELGEMLDGWNGFGLRLQILDGDET